MALVLGYDKVGQEYVINEAQAKTVRKIFDMCLAGSGSQKIKRQLEKDGDLTAMGKSLWHYATISRVLKNRLYCGELEYRKEYVPDYLEQKRVDLCQYFRQKKLKDYTTFFSSSSSFC